MTVKTIARVFKIFSIIVLCFSAVHAQTGGNPGIGTEPSVEASLDRSTIALGDQTVLRLKAHLKAGDSIRFPLFSDSIVSKLEIVRASKIDTLFDKADPAKETITASFTVTSFKSGTYNLPSFRFTSRGKSYTTSGLILVVTPVAIDTSKSIYDIKRPIAVNYTFLDWIKGHAKEILFSAAALLLLFAAYRYVRLRPKKAPSIIQPVEVRILPEQKATLELERLASEKLPQAGEFKVYYSRISEIVRTYLEEKYAFTALEQTTDEIMKVLREMGPQSTASDNLEQLLVLADLVKFAKERPGVTRCEKSMNDALTFVKLTSSASTTQGAAHQQNTFKEEA